MKRTGRKFLIIVCALCLLFAGCGGKSQGEAVATLGKEKIYLSEAVFYTRMMQEQWENSYYGYFGETMWQTDLGEEGTLEEALKSSVVDTLKEIYLLCSHAKDYEVELTEEEKAVVAERAEEFMASNTPSVLEAAGATEAYVEELLLRNELAAKVAAAVKADCEPQVDEEAARLGKLTYCLFSTMGTYDIEGNHTPATEEELVQIQAEAESFAARAQELRDILAAGEEISHPVIDVYFNEETDGGAHELVAKEARGLETGAVSGVIKTDEGYYIVQNVSEYDEEATAENIELLKEDAREEYLRQKCLSWEQETPFLIDAEVWDTVRVDKMLTGG